MSSARIFQAVGLGFSDGVDSAPSVTVKGDFALAEMIVEIARRAGVPVVERDDLCQSLSGVPLDSKIPQELYEAAAAILREVDALGID